MKNSLLTLLLRIFAITYKRIVCTLLNFVNGVCLFMLQNFEINCSLYELWKQEYIIIWCTKCVNGNKKMLKQHEQIFFKYWKLCEHSLGIQYLITCHNGAYVNKHEYPYIYIYMDYYYYIYSKINDRVHRYNRLIVLNSLLLFSLITQWL